MNWNELSNLSRGTESSDSRPTTFAQICAPPNLLQAWERVRRNQGCGGVDRISIKELETQFPQAAFHLSEALLGKRYKPRPLRRVDIPKTGGGTRTLGIPCVLDRVVQQAMHQVLQPLFEPRFSPHSFGYRPGRGPLDAVNHIRDRLARPSWVLHLDIDSFFDSVPHEQALMALRRVTSDQQVEGLARQILRCGVLEQGRVQPTDAGLPQGSPLSPLLANAVLDQFDQWLDVRGAVFARYADDIVVACDSAAEADALCTQAAQVLQGCGLGLNCKKTTTTPAADATFLSLGFFFTPTGKCLRRIAPAALKDLEEGLEAKSAATDGSPEAMATAAAELWLSWLGYFRATEMPEELLQACAVARDVVRKAIWTAWQTDSRRLEELRRRGVPAADQNTPSAILLRRVFPDEWFVRYGLSLAVPKPSRCKHLPNYNGQLPGGGVPSNNLWVDTLKCWGWSFLRSGWFRMTCELRTRERGWIPRPEGLRFYLGRHQIFWRF